MEPADQPPVRPPAVAAVATPPEAVEFLPDADEIERQPLHRGIPVTLYLLTALLTVMLLWATFSDVDEVVVTRGRLVTPLPNIVLQTMETSLIEKLHVRVGQVVKKGETLATLDPTFASADLAQVRDRLASMDTQSRRLEAELAGKRYQAVRPVGDEALQAGLASEKHANYDAKLARFDETVARLKASLETNARERTALDDRVRSLAEIEGMQEKLSAQQFQSRMKLLESRERRQEVERDQVVARHKEAELRRELAGAVADRTAFVKEWRQKSMEELVTARRERDSLSDQVQKADRRSRLVTLVAPVDAVVLDIAKRSAGSVVREAEPLITLVPLDAPLEAEVQVESDDVGWLKLGDRARIKIDSFPFQKHGVLLGSVRTVSEDAFAREGMMRQPNQRTDAYYLSRIELGEDRLKKVPRKTRLLPGMTLTAEIVVGKRSVISYFLYPIIRSLDEAIREP